MSSLAKARHVAQLVSALGQMLGVLSRFMAQRRDVHSAQCVEPPHVTDDCSHWMGGSAACCFNLRGAAELPSIDCKRPCASAVAQIKGGARAGCKRTLERPK
jgi:hypothetical protein